MLDAANPVESSAVRYGTRNGDLPRPECERPSRRRLVQPDVIRPVAGAWHRLDCVSDVNVRPDGKRRPAQKTENDVGARSHARASSSKLPRAAARTTPPEPGEPRCAATARIVEGSRGISRGTSKQIDSLLNPNAALEPQENSDFLRPYNATNEPRATADQRATAPFVC